MAAARVAFDVEAELAGEAHCPKHPHGILAIAFGREADHPQPALAHVGMAFGEIDDGAIAVVVVEAVHREVAAPGILLQRAVDVVAHDASVDPHMVRIGSRLVEVGAEGRDLDDLPAHAHVREPESAADEPAAPEQPAYGLRRRAGRDVEILRLEAQQQIPNASTDEIGAVTGLGQRLENFEGAPADVSVGDAMLRWGDDDGLSNGAFDPGRFNGERLVGILVERFPASRIIAVRPASPYLSNRAPFV